MSINSAMLAGVSGLAANTAALGAISDNIVNVNTVGFKQNRTDFESLVTASAQRGNYNPGGVRATVTSMVSQQGQVTQSSSATDLAINGRGFFVTTNKATGVADTDAHTFTRAGAFTVDDKGYLKNSNGLYLQGWPADDKGVVSTDPSDLSRLTTINVNAAGGAPNPTSTAAIDGNLNSAQALSPQVGTYNAATNSMAAYDPAAAAGVKPDFTMQVPVFDSKGSRHTFEIDYLKSATPNQWYAEIRAVPAADVQGAGSNGQLASGIVAFTPDGKFDPAATTLPLNIALGASAAGTGQSWATGLGLAAQRVDLNVTTSPGSLTQYAIASGTNSVTGDGGPVGALTNVAVDDNGYVTANFDNGRTRRIGQVALATFNNPEGLTAVPGTGFQVSNLSGGYTLKAPKSDGAGAISPSSLESSTVDLSAQFTGLITTQRAYSASSKIITTGDQMLQELIDIKR